MQPFGCFFCLKSMADIKILGEFHIYAKNS